MLERTVEQKRKDCEQTARLTIWFQGEFSEGFEKRIKRLFSEVLFVLDKSVGAWLGRLESVVVIEGGCCRRLTIPEPLPNEDWEHRYQIILSLSACDRSDEGLKRLFAHELSHLALNHCLERERLGSVCIEKQEAEAKSFCEEMGF